jgi:aldehyde dehydrogenase (NAD+)
MKELLANLQLTEHHPGTCIGTKWLETKQTLNAFTPITGKKLLTVQASTEKELSSVIEEAKNAFYLWRQIPAPKRGELIHKIGLKLRKNKDLLGSLVSLEVGKSKTEGDGEVQEMIDMADFAVGQARMLYGKTMHSERPEHRMYEQWHPLGPIGVISAFNFPVAVWSWNAFIAAICGNTVVWRPSPKTPLCSLAIQKLCAQVLEEEKAPAVFCLITTEDVALSKAFVDNPALPLISFTGSTKVGKRVAAQVAVRLGRSILELSGNNGAILDESANLKQALPSILFGAVGTAGQRCTTLRRLFVHYSRYKEVLSSLTKAYSSLKVGDPLDSSNHLGPLIDQEAVNHFLKAVETVKQQGGEILFGGKTLNTSGYYVEPTLVKAEKPLPLMQEETFGPLLYVTPYKNFEEAIALNNASSHGLSSALFTENIRHSESFLSCQGSDCGIANINIGTSGAEIGGAFGGEKDTGGGREAGSDAWKSYMRRQTCTISYGKKVELAQGVRF